MKVYPIKTRVFLPPKDDLLSFIKESFSSLTLKEKSIIVITSKIVAIWQGRCIKMNSVKSKDELIKKEADFYIDRDKVPKGYVILTIKNNILIPTSGIDESNANGYYILWPEKSMVAAKHIYQFIKKTYKLKKFGVIISDSHCTPLKNGVMGIAIGYHGFHPLRDYRGKKDIFKRTLKMSQTNIADSVAVAAVLVMGEGKEQTPIAIAEDLENIVFNSIDYTIKDPLIMDKDNDIYAPLIKETLWEKGKN